MEKLDIGNFCCLIRNIGSHGNIKGNLFQESFSQQSCGGQLELNTHVFYIDLYINCVYGYFDMSAFVAMETSFHCLKMEKVEKAIYCYVISNI